jgi:hypothetical protein
MNDYRNSLSQSILRYPHLRSVEGAVRVNDVRFETRYSSARFFVAQKNPRPNQPFSAISISARLRIGWNNYHRFHSSREMPKHFVEKRLFYRCNHEQGANQSTDYLNLKLSCVSIEAIPENQSFHVVTVTPAASGTHNGCLNR